MRSNKELEALASKYPKVKLEDWSQSIYRTIYFPHLPANYYESEQNYIDLLINTGCAIIPGTYNKLPPELGLNFRVNLSLMSAEYISQLRCVFSYLCSQELR